MRDPGLQPERTALAWSRTVLSLLACAGTSLKFGLEGDSPNLVFSGGVMLTGAVALFGTSILRIGKLNVMRQIQSPPEILMAATSLVCGISALLFIAVRL